MDKETAYAISAQLDKNAGFKNPLKILETMKLSRKSSREERRVVNEIGLLLKAIFRPKKVPIKLQAQAVASHASDGASRDDIHYVTSK